MRPVGIVADGTGNLYVTDSFRNSIQQISTGGLVTLFAGSTSIAGSADGLAADAQFNSPAGLALDGAGNLYIADSQNDAIRKGQPAGPPIITTQPQNQSVTNGSNVQLNTLVTSFLSPSFQWYYNNTAIGGATSSTLNLSSVTAATAGSYTVVITNPFGGVTSSTATVTVTNASTPPPTGGSGGGGGKIPAWFAVALIALVAWRLKAAAKVGLH